MAERLEKSSPLHPKNVLERIIGPTNGFIQFASNFEFVSERRKIGLHSFTVTTGSSLIKNASYETYAPTPEQKFHPKTLRPVIMGKICGITSDGQDVEIFSATYRQGIQRVFCLTIDVGGRQQIAVPGDEWEFTPEELNDITKAVGLI